MRALHFSIRLYRAGTALIALAWAFYCFGYIASLGTKLLPALLISSTFAIPIALLPALNRSISVTCVRVLGVLLLASTMAYSWLAIESAVLLRPTRNVQAVTSVQRHWPFSTSAVVYLPDHSVLWQD